jgi:hypothetical protein
MIAITNHDQSSFLLRRLSQPAIEPAGLFGVLVDLVLAHLAPGDPAPDHVAVVVDPAVLGIVEVNVATDADRLPPWEALEDQLIGMDLQADLDEALEPAFEVFLFEAPGANELSPGKLNLTSSA